MADPKDDDVNARIREQAQAVLAESGAPLGITPPVRKGWLKRAAKLEAIVNEAQALADTWAAEQKALKKACDDQMTQLLDKADRPELRLRGVSHADVTMGWKFMDTGVTVMTFAPANPPKDPTQSVKDLYQKDDAFAELAQQLQANQPTHYRGGPCSGEPVEQTLGWKFVNVPGLEAPDWNPRPRVTCRACLMWAALQATGLTSW